jgi:hypothetical protein
MSIWYVHRRANNSISSAHQQIQPGYAEEALDDTTSADLQAYLQGATTKPDLSDPETLDKALKAVLFAAGGMAGKTPAQSRAAFKTAWEALP